MNAGYRNFNSDVQETKTDTARALRIHQHSIYPEVKVRIRLSDRLYADMTGRYLFHNMNVEFLDPDAFCKQFFNAEIMVNAILDKARQNALFFRWRMYDNISTRDKEIHQLQFGYKLNFNSFIKSSIKKI